MHRSERPDESILRSETSEREEASSEGQTLGALVDRLKTGIRNAGEGLKSRIRQAAEEISDVLGEVLAPEPELIPIPVRRPPRRR